jgi:uncharacterized protein YjaZ
MRVVDLIPGYLKYIVEEDNYVRYQNMYPQLFEHYYRFWAERTIHQSILKKNEIIKKRDFIISAIKKVIPILVKLNSRTKEIPITLFIGENISNGHAFLDDNEFVVWIPIERYATFEEARVFVTHEIIHALHYSLNRDFYFNTVEEKNNISRLLFTEGLATYLTRELLNLKDKEALWADFLKKRQLNDWMEQCEDNLPSLKKYIHQRINLSDPEIKLFIAENPSDIFSYRSGYFVGLRLVDQLAQTYSLTYEELLLLSKTDMEKLTVEWLES